MKRRLSLQAASALALMAVTARATAQPTGVIHVDPELPTIIVDGALRHVNDGAVLVACGTHTITVPPRDGRVVEVPCGGAFDASEGTWNRPPTRARPASSSSWRSRHKVGPAGRLHGGLGHRRLFHNTVLGADFTASAGAYIDKVDLYFDLQLLFGSTEGLPLWQVRVGPSVNYEVLSRVRLGIGVSVGGTAVSRATNDKTLHAFSAGARVFASVDVWRLGERAGVYVLGQLSVDSAGPLFNKRRGDVPDTTLWGPTVAVGVRF